MKFTLSWLRDFLQSDVSIDDIMDALTDLGLEVEGVEDRAVALSGFTVAHIIAAVQHEQADRLRVCRVDTGDGELQIVCGAPNARAGLKVALAPVGAVVPANGMKIRKSEIRGVESCGMMCSGAELGLSGDGEGIIELPEDAVVGQDLAVALGLDEPVIELSITPNRADAFGIYGIARDLAARGLGQLRPMEEAIAALQQKCNAAPQHISGAATRVSIDADISGAYIALQHISDVTIGQSPDWLQKRLRDIGVEPVSNAVDIVNYFMFSFNRPAHVYDADKLEGALKLRYAQEGEEFAALNDKTYKLTAQDIVIADENQVQSLAGIMGAQASTVTEDTKNILLEIALFDQISVARSGRRLGLTSDSRHRFERGIDPAFAAPAKEALTSLICGLCCGAATGCSEAGAVNAAPAKKISFNVASHEKLTGRDISPERAVEILAALGCAVQQKEDGNMFVTPPTWRHDISIEQDIIEELLRVEGYAALQHMPMPVCPTLVNKPDAQAILRRSMAHAGLDEVVTFSFISREEWSDFAVQQNPVEVANPIAPQYSFMRPSILPSLLNAAAHNMRYTQQNIRIFEIGPVFAGTLPQEQQTQFAALLCGRDATPNPHKNPRDFDVFDAKSVLEQAIATLAPTLNPQTSRQTPGYYHPGRSGTLTLGKNPIGYFGQLHPQLVEKYDISAQAVAVELMLQNIPLAKKKSTQRPALTLSKLQPVSRDFAFIAPQQTLAQDITTPALKADKAIADVQIFDIFTGSGVPDEHKSVAMRVTMQPNDKSFTDTELEQISQKIVAAVQKNTRAQLRT